MNDLSRDSSVAMELSSSAALSPSALSGVDFALEESLTSPSLRRSPRLKSRLASSVLEKTRASRDGSSGSGGCGGKEGESKTDRKKEKSLKAVSVVCPLCAYMYTVCLEISLKG